MPFVPNGPRVLITPDDEKKETAGGLLIPGGGLSTFRTGVIAALGSGLTFGVGDRVGYNNDKAIELKGNGLSGVLLEGEDVYGTLEA